MSRFGFSTGPIDDLEAMGLVDNSPPPQQEDDLEALGLLDTAPPPEAIGTPEQPEEEQDQGATFMDFFRLLKGPSGGSASKPGDDIDFERSRQKALESMGFEGDPQRLADAEGNPLKDTDLDMADRIAHTRLTQEYNPDKDPKKQKEIDSKLAEHVAKRDQQRRMAQDFYGNAITVGGTPLKESWVGKAPLPVRAAFQGAAQTGAAIENAVRRSMGYNQQATDVRNALNILDKYNGTVSEESLLGRSVGPMADDIAVSLTQGTLAMPGGLVTIAGVFGLDQMDSAMTEASNQGLNGTQQAMHGVANFLIGGALTYLGGKTAMKLGLDPGDAALPLYSKAMQGYFQKHGLTRLGAGALLNGGEEAVQELATAWEEVRSGVNPNALDNIGDRVFNAFGQGTIGAIPAGSISEFNSARRKFEADLPDIIRGVDDANADYKVDREPSEPAREYTEQDLAQAADMYLTNSEKINSELREGKVPEDARKLDVFLKRRAAKDPQHRTTYRGMKFDSKEALDQFVKDNFEEGGTYSDPAFLSTSMSEGKADSFATGEAPLVMEVEGVSGGVFHEMGEAEVMYPRGTKFEVSGVETRDGKTVVKLREKNDAVGVEAELAALEQLENEVLAGERKFSDEAYADAYKGEMEAIRELQEELERNNPTRQTREELSGRREQYEELKREYDELRESVMAEAHARSVSLPEGFSAIREDFDTWGATLEQERQAIEEGEAAIAEMDRKYKEETKADRQYLDQEQFYRDAKLDDQKRVVDTSARAFLESELERIANEAAETDTAAPSDGPIPEPVYTDGGYMLPDRTGTTLLRRVATGAGVGAVAGASIGPGGAALGAAFGGLVGASPIFGERAVMSASLGETLQASAGKLPAPVRARAQQLAQQIKDSSMRVFSEEKKMLGRLSPKRNAILAMAQKFIGRTTPEAREAHSTVVVNDRVVAGESVLTEALEGRLPLSQLSDGLQEYVKAVWDIQQDMARISTDELRVRQPVPSHRQEARRAALDTGTTSELQRLHAELLPNHAVPSGREQLLDKLSTVRFFEPFPEGKVRLRVQTDKMREIRQQGESHELYQPLMQAIASMNGITLDDTHAAMKPYVGVNVRKAATEVPRIFERFPDYLQVDGVKYDLLESSPMAYAQQSIENFATTAANIKEFGQQVIQPNNVSKQEGLRDGAIEAGLDAGLVDAAMNSMSGAGTAGGVAPEVRANNSVLRSLANVVRASMLSGSFLAQLPEGLGNQTVYGGVRRALKAYQAFLPRALTTQDYRDALVAAERIGAYVENYSDFTYDRMSKLDSLARIYGNSVLAVSKWAWDTEAKQAAVLGYTIAEDLRQGRGTEGDLHVLSDMAGYSKAEAQRLVDRNGTTVEDYHEAARRIAANVSITDMTPGISKSPVEHQPKWNLLQSFTTYPLHRIRTTERQVNRTASAVSKWLQDPTAANGLEAGKAFGGMAKYMGLVTASGALQLALRNMFINYGPREGLQLTWEEMEDDPIGFAARSFRAAMLGPIVDSLLFSVERDGEVNPAAAVPLSQPIFEGFHAIQAMTGGSDHWAYRDKSPIEVAATYAKRNFLAKTLLKMGNRVAEIDGLAPVMYPLGLGMEDERLRASMKRYYDFLDDKNEGRFTFVGELPEEEKTMRKHLKAFTDELKKVDTPERAKKLEQHLYKALDVSPGDNASFVRKLRNKRLIPKIPKEYITEFAEKHPEDYDRLSDYDSVIGGWADYLAQFN